MQGVGVAHQGIFLNAVGADHTLLTMAGRGHTLLTMAGRGHTLLTTASAGLTHLTTASAGLTHLTTAGAGPTLGLPLLTVGHLLADVNGLTLLMIQGTATVLSLEACRLGQGGGQGGATHAVSHPGLGGALGGATHAVFPLDKGAPGVILEAFLLNQGAQRGVVRMVVHPGMYTLGVEVGV